MKKNFFKAGIISLAAMLMALSFTGCPLLLETTKITGAQQIDAYTFRLFVDGCPSDADETFVCTLDVYQNGRKTNTMTASYCNYWSAFTGYAILKTPISLPNNAQVIVYPAKDNITLVGSASFTTFGYGESEGIGELK